MNPTLIGLFSIFVWGLSAPIVRLISAHIGAIAYTGVLFTVIAVLGFSYHFWRKTRWDKAIFRNKYLYWRWFFFCLHTVSFVFSVALIDIEYLPLVILINYLWPTAVILYSVLLAGVKITRWPAFTFGLCIVFAALSTEIAGELLFTTDLALSPKDYAAFAIVFVGANAWGLYSALSRKAADSTGGGTVIPFFQITLGAFLPYALLTDMANFRQHPFGSMQGLPVTPFFPCSPISAGTLACEKAAWSYSVLLQT